MMAITVKFLGGLRQDMGMASCILWLPDDATVADLEPRLRALGLDLDAEKNIAVLNQRGLSQWPPDRRLESDEVVMVFPHIAGGTRHPRQPGK
jgi:molybdopterin converting factor small subunit